MLLKKNDTKLWLYYMVGAYSLVNKTGLLRSRFVRPIFERLYFLYKALAKDPLKTLVQYYPDFIENGHVLDIGSNIGYTVGVLESALSPGFKIFAFEPDKNNFESLSNRYNKNRNVSCQQAAVGAECGEITLWHNEDSHADHRILTPKLSSLLNAQDIKDSYQVRCVDIDSFLSEHSIASKDISFIKIDVQGFEINVLKGLRNTLEENSDIKIMIEFDKSALRDLGFDPEHLLNLIMEYGFKFWRITTKGALIPIGKQDLLSDQYTHHTDLVLKKIQ